MTSMMFTLAVESWIIGIGAFLFFLVSLIMIGVVLIQKPKGGGLSGAFGGGAGGGSSSSVLGARAGDVLTWFTIGCFVVFLLLGILMVYGTDPDSFLNTEKPAVTATDADDEDAKEEEKPEEKAEEKVEEAAEKVEEKAEGNTEAPTEGTTSPATQPAE